MDRIGEIDEDNEMYEEDEWFDELMRKMIFLLE